MLHILLFSRQQRAERQQQRAEYIRARRQLECEHQAEYIRALNASARQLEYERTTGRVTLPPNNDHIAHEFEIEPPST